MGRNLFFVAAALAAVVASGAEYDIAALVYPGYHPEPRWKELGLFPEGQGEWFNVKDAKPKWKGHYQPRVPKWGYENEADPKVMEKKIEAASSHGVNVFIFDWYWYGERPFLERTVADGFLGAKNNGKMKFFLMWANHNWSDCVDKRASAKHSKTIWLGGVDGEAFRRMTRRVIEKFLSRPNYYRIGGKPVFMIYEVGSFVKGMGGMEKAAAALRQFDDDCAKAGLGGVHLMACSWGQCKPEHIAALGIESATMYTYAHHVRPNGDYAQWAEKGLAKLDSEKARLKGLKAYFAHASVGWDNNPRFPEKMPCVTGSSPEKFEKVLLRAKDWCDRNTPPGYPKLISINAWNEWIEGSYLEPDEKYGMGYLEAIRRVFAPATPFAADVPQDMRFERVWEGRNILDAALPFPEGVTFVPGAEYRAEVKNLPAEMRIENAEGDVLMRFAAPTNVAPPFTMHVAVTGANSPAVFATKDGKTTLAYIARKPGDFDPRRQEYARSLSVKSEGGAGTVEARLSPGVGQADVRFVTRGREGRPYIEDGRLYFTFSARFYASVTGVGSLDAAHPERGVRFEGVILYDYGDGLFRNDLAPHIFFDDEAGEWRGWACNFSTGGDKLGGRAKGGVNAVWSKSSPLHGLAIMKAKSLGLENMHEDPCGVWDPDAKKWRMFVCRFVKGIKAVMLESDRWDGGYKEIAGPVAHDSTGTTIAWANGTRYCLSGSSDRAYYVYSYPELKMLGKLQMSPTPWGSASGRPHGRGWPAFAELPDGYPHKYILLTMDRVNFPGMPKPNWTYGGLQIYVPANFVGTEACRPPADAVVLFDGTQRSLDANWTDMKGRKAKWRCVDGTIEATRAAGDIRTRREFGDVQLHIEWQVPANLPPYDMNSGNSGVFLMGLYELQVFESYETDPADMKHPFYADGQAAAIYGQNPPLVNPTRRRGEWQTYDIVFRRPVFDGATCVRPAVITAFLNGVLVQDGWKIEGPTGHLRRTRQTKPPSDKGPVKLQQHLCSVRFRNVWVRELPEGLKSRKEKK